VNAVRIAYSVRKATPVLAHDEAAASRPADGDRQRTPEVVGLGTWRM
jgi:hypothetical protein